MGNPILVKFKSESLSLTRCAKKVGVALETLKRHISRGLTPGEISELVKKRGAKLKYGTNLNSSLIDLTGKRFNRLVVIRDTGAVRGRSHVWLCRCNCGKHTKVDGHSLRKKNTQSCGCLSLETLAAWRRKHGWNKTREQKIWNAMKQRCYNTKNKRYKHYGGRGIIVCNRWLKSLDNFIKDMGRRPKGRLTIERINNNGNYTPQNCRWATYSEQSRNNSRTRNVTYQGTTMCITDWASELQMPRDTLNWHINKGRTIGQVIKIRTK